MIKALAIVLVTLLLIGPILMNINKHTLRADGAWIIHYRLLDMHVLVYIPYEGEEHGTTSEG